MRGLSGQMNALVDAAPVIAILLGLGAILVVSDRQYQRAIRDARSRADLGPLIRVGGWIGWALIFLALAFFALGALGALRA